MANKTTVSANFKLNFSANDQNVTKTFQSIQNSFNNATKNLTNTKSFRQYSLELDNIYKQIRELYNSDDFSTGTIKQINSLQKEATGLLTKMQSSYQDIQNRINKNPLTLLSKEELNKYNEAKKSIAEIGELQTKIASLNRDSKSYAEANQKLQQLLGQQEQYQTIINTTDQKLQNTKNTYTSIEKELATLLTQHNTYVQQINRENQALLEQERINQEIANLREQILSFFTIASGVQIFQRSLRDAYKAVQDLDNAMTETAVVTEMTISDLWGQLPEYTKRANELGVATLGAYEAATLYYQQGLSNNQVTEVSIETLKMARIANMDAANATELMTAALRGFNMEINAMNAQRINDVYSELAAISAADTEQIGIAMSKMASIANNANMELETTAALVTQIIETTQEAPETAGTAMKTVIARFQELTKSPNEIGEVDGEIIDANKIETALRSVGVALRDKTTGMFRDLDDVFLELASKWNSLDTNTQRYIATIAAGSRQQSRFIAMMSDYDRTMELVEAAYNSTGAAQEQFEKTQDSLTSKINRLTNEWNAFTMGLADDTLIKGTVDLLTQLMNTVNSLTDVLGGGVLTSIARIAIIGGGLFSGRKLLNQWTTNAYQTMSKSLASAVTKVNEKFNGITFTDLFKNDTNILANISLNSDQAKQQFRNIFARTNLLDTTQLEQFANISLDNLFNAKNVKDFEKEFKNITTQLNLSNDAANQLLRTTKQQFLESQKVDKSIRNWNIGLGIATVAITSLTSALVDESDGLSEVELGMQGLASGVTAAAMAFTLLNSVGITSLSVLGPIGAVVGLISAGLSIFNSWNAEQERLRQEAIDTATDVQNSVESQNAAIQSYYELSEAQKDSQTVTEDMRDAAQELVDTYGLEIDNLTLLTGSYEELNAAMKAALNTKLQENIVDLKAGYETQKEDYRNAMLEEGKTNFFQYDMYGTGTDDNQVRVAYAENLTKEQEEVISSLVDKGIIDKVNDSMQELTINLDEISNDDLQYLKDIIGDKQITAIQNYIKNLDSLSGNLEIIADQYAQLAKVNGDVDFSQITSFADYEEMRKAFYEYLLDQGETEEDATQYTNLYTKSNDTTALYEDQYQQLQNLNSVIETSNADTSTQNAFKSYIRELATQGLLDAVNSEDLSNALGGTLNDFQTSIQAQLNNQTYARDQLIKSSINDINSVLAADDTSWSDIENDQINTLIGQLSQIPGLYNASKTAAEEFQQLINTQTGDLEKSNYLLGLVMTKLQNIDQLSTTTTNNEGVEELVYASQSMVDSFVNDMETATDSINEVRQSYAELTSYINSDRTINTENLERAIELYPEILAGAEMVATAEGNRWKISEEMSQRLVELYEEEASASGKTVKEKINNAITELEAKNEVITSEIELVQAALAGEQLSASEEAKLKETVLKAESDYYGTKEEMAITAENSTTQALEQSNYALLQNDNNTKTWSDNQINYFMAAAKAASEYHKSVTTGTYNNVTGAAKTGSIDTSSIAKTETSSIFDSIASGALKSLSSLQNINTASVGEQQLKNTLAYLQQARQANEVAITRLKAQLANLDKVYDFSSGSGSSSSGSSAGTQTDDWVNEYDKLYNLVEDVAELQRDINKLQHEYDSLLADSTKTSADLLRNINSQKDALEQSLKLQKEIQVGRDQEMKDYLAANQHMSKVATYNWEDQTIEINWDYINANKDSELGDAIDEYISKLEEIQDKMESIEDDIQDTNDALDELKNIGKDEYVDFENAVKDALVKYYQDQIDEFQQLSDSINTANSNLVNSIQNTINLERQNRDNADTEQSIAESERRLAFLRQDTSGANQLEILQLEKELSEQKESYTDQLIDQKITELQNQNDEAQEAREQQIALMQSQLQALQDSGAIWTEVQSLMVDGTNILGQLVQGSQLESILKNNESWTGLSEIQQMHWLDELNNQMKIANIYLSSQKQLENIGKTSGQITFTNANGQTLTGTIQKDGSVKVTDSKGTYTYKDVYQKYDGTYATFETSGDFVANKPTTPSNNTPSTSGNNNSTTTAPPSLKPGQYVEVKPGTKWYFTSYGAAPYGKARSGKIKYTNTKAPYGYNIEGLGWIKKTDIVGYKTGGLADFTGPAWLDGTRSKPEIVLNSKDTQNFLELRDILRDLETAEGDNGNTAYYYNVEIKVDKLENQYDVDQLMTDIENHLNTQARYRNVNAINLKK